MRVFEMLTGLIAIWPFDWLIGLKGALPRDLISEKQYPKVFAWVARFNKVTKAAKAAAKKPTTLTGDAAAQRILNARFADKEIGVDGHDPLGLKHGDQVEVWPTDSGMRHKDRGRLIGLSTNEVVLEVKPDGESKEIRLHFPRTNFRIEAVKGRSAPKL